jgi:peptide/nickel transport system permease protein
MSRYIIRRVLWGLLLLIAVSALTFVLFRILPTADPAKLRAGRLQSPKIIAEIRHDLGLDKSLPEQFWLYMKGIFLHFNLGYSYYSNAPVKELIFNRLPATLSLVLGGAVIWLFAGLGVGIISARRAGSKLDRATMGTALVLVSAPEYWLGLLALFFFASDIGKIHVFPGAGSYVGLTAEPSKWFTSLIMPWLVVAAGTAAIYARLLRGSLIETMGEDYIRTARAKGLSERRVVLRHGLRAAINPIVTVLGVDIAVALGSSVLVETVFDIPGIGRLNYVAITHSDFPIIQGTVLLAGLFVVIANIVVDIAYALLDPRVRYS